MNKISFVSKRSHATTLRTKFWDAFKSRKVIQTPYLQPSPHTYEIKHENGHKTQITDEYLFVKDHLSRAKIPKSTSDYLKQERDYLQDYVTQEKTITHYAKQIEEIRSKLQMGPEKDRVNSLEIVGEYLYFEVQLAKKRPIYVRINAPDINVALKEVTNDAIFTAVRDLTRKKKQEIMSVRSSISLGGVLATMQVVLDQNVDLPDYTVLTKCKLSPSQRYVAYLCDSGSSELIIRDVRTRKVIAKINDDSVTSVEFSDDELSVYVTSSDEMHRSCQLSRYDLQTRTVKDIYYEKDTTFFIEVTRTKDDKHLLLNCANKSCNQNFIIDGDELKPITSREEGVYNAITSDGSEFVIVTNRGSPNHKVMRAPIDTIADLSSWKEYVSHSDTSRIDDIDVFSDRIALYETYNDGFGRIRVIEKNGNATTVPLPDMVCVSPGVNQGASHLTFSAYSPVLIPVNYIYDLETGMLSKTNIVAVGAQEEIANTYTMERHYATSHDGEQVPLTIVFDRNQVKKNGHNPMLVHCYGAYGSSLERKNKFFYF
jgi:protease II